MKTTCPNCKYILEFDETHFTPGEIAHLECPMCGQEIEEMIKATEVEVKDEKKETPSYRGKSASSSTPKTTSPDQNTQIQELNKRIQELEKNQSMQQQFIYEDEELERAGCWGIGCSLLFPIAGVVLYYTQKDKVENAKVYLWCALAGFILAIIFF